MVSRGVALPAGARVFDGHEVYEGWWPSILAWIGVQTAWRSMAITTADKVVLITTGLDYPAVQVVLGRMGLTDAEQDAVFADIQIMEREALDIFNEGNDG